MTSPPFRVETVPVRRTGRGPVLIAALAMTLVAVSIVKPWSGVDPGAADPSRDFGSPAAVAIRPAVAANPEVEAPAAPSPRDHSPAVVSPAPAQPEAAQGIAAVEPAPLAPGQVDCGSSGWDLVTLGSFLRWTVRTLTAITPVDAGGPGDPSIPVLSLGESDVSGLGACAPSISPVAPGRASRIVEAWRRGPAGAATWERVTLAQLDPLPCGGPAAAHLTPASVTELYRPVPASPHGRWPAGRYVLLLASPDASADRWIGIEIGAGK